MVFFSSAIVQSQSVHTIGIQPASGPAGTTVVISDISGTNAGKLCSVTGPSGTQNIGAMQGGGLTYVIPSNAAPGATFSFTCTGSAPGSTTNTVTFTAVIVLVIVSPEPVDSDGDGTPDNGDQCPNLAGPRENRGCPVEQAPVDSDGDGVPDNADACPNQAGLPEVNGCAPSPAPQLPALPVDGPCVLATLEAAPVNIRQGTSTDTAIVGQLDPLQVYSVIGRNEDGSWLQINGGWVAAFVIRQGGDCSALANTNLASGDITLLEPASDQGLLVPAIQGVRDAASRMGNCQEYLPAVDAMPTFLALYIVGDADPCAAAAAEMDDLFFNPAPQASPYVPDNACPEGFPGANEMIPVFNSLLYNAPAATADYLASLAADISESPSLFCTLLMDMSNGGITEFTFPADEHVLPVAYLWCDVVGSYLDSTAAKLQAIAIAPFYLRNLNGACLLFEDLRVLGSVGTGNVQFFNLLIQNCAVPTADAAHRAFSDAVRGALDAASAANQGCAGLQLLENYPLPSDLQPLLPQIAAQNPTCTGNFRVLATHNPALGAETLYRILKSVDPCAAATAFAYNGDVPANVVPPPDCIQGNQLILQGAAQVNQVVLDSSSSWFEKITALDRPQNEICTLPAQLGPGGAFAANPTPTMGAFVANPTATLPEFAANPTATLPQFAANPTATPLPPEGEEPPAQEEPEAPAEPAGQEPPLPPDGQGVPPAQGGGCFGCLPADPLIPGGRVQSVVVASDAEGRFAGLFVAPALQTPTSPDAVAVAPGQQELIPLPMDGLPTPLDGYPASILADGTMIGYFARGVDPASLPPSAAHVAISLGDGTTVETSPDQAVTFTAIALAESGGSMEIVRNLQFPAGLTPAPYAPALTADDSLMLMALTDATGMTSIYMLPLESESGTVTPQMVVQNATAPSVSPNGRYLAFERAGPTGRNIYALALNSLLENPITQQTPGSECYGAKFGANSLTVYFTCQAGDQTQMYAYGLSGVTPINTSIPNARNPSPSDLEGYILFDDGATVYLSADDGSNPQPYHQVRLQNVRITSYSVNGAGLD
jgi:hypothetical protein